MGIEPTSEARLFKPWEACNITQKHAGLAAFSQFSEPLNWKIMENEIGCKAGSLILRDFAPSSSSRVLSHICPNPFA
jgi:hypothetical protein